MTNEITPGGVLANLKGWSFTVNGTENRYKMTGEEAEAIIPVLKRNQAREKNKLYDAMRYACPECGNDVDVTDVFCRMCGQRLSR